MRFQWIALSMIVLTQLDGKPIWVESHAVQIIRPASKQCQAVNGSGIQVGNVALCVRETPQEIQDKIRKVGQP